MNFQLSLKDKFHDFFLLTRCPTGPAGPICPGSPGGPYRINIFFMNRKTTFRCPKTTHATIFLMNRKTTFRMSKDNSCNHWPIPWIFFCALVCRSCYPYKLNFSVFRRFINGELEKASETISKLPLDQASQAILSIQDLPFHPVKK